MHQITVTQARAMDFLRSFSAENGFPPTRVEIAAGLGYKSGNAAHEMMMRLERKGFIRITKNQTRSIQIIDSQPSVQTTQPGQNEEFRLTKIRDAIKDRNPSLAHSLLIGNAEKFADAFIGDLLPTSKSAQFLFRQHTFIETHLNALFSRVEGKPGATKKTAAAIQILTTTFLPVEDFSSDENITNIEIATGKTFRTQSELFRFFDALQDLHGGCGARYFEFLRNHNPTKKSLSSDLKSQQAYYAR